MIFFHGTTKEKWNEIQQEGILFGRRFVTDNDGNIIQEVDRCTYLAVDFAEACCYGDVVLAVEYDPFVRPNKNNYVDDCWQVRVYEPIELKNIKDIKFEKYIRIGEVSSNDEELPVYRCFKFDDNWHIILPSPITESTINTLNDLRISINDNKEKVYLCSGDKVRITEDSKVIINNVVVLSDITEYFML